MVKGLAKSRPLLIFLHLPKTAGSTLMHVLEQEYGASGILTLYDSFFGEELATIPRGQLEGISVVMGHFYFGAHTFLPRPAIYVTILRHPVDRVISHYHYVRRNPDHYLYTSAQAMSLEEFVISCGRYEPNNDQTRLLAGKELAATDGACTADMLPMAKKNLREHFAIVGITEQFDQSLLLMKRVLGWRHPYYIRRNVSRGRPQKEAISPETIRTIRSYHQLDYALYGYARARLQKEVTLQGESFKREVRLFQIMNAFKSKWHRLAGRNYWTLTRLN